MPSGLCEDTGGAATALIERMAQGNRQALEEIFAMWGPAFLGIAQRMLGDSTEASKVVRTTFVRMWQRASRYDPHESPPFVWAYTILRGLCIDRLHRRRRTKTPAPARQRPAAEDPRVMPPDDWRRLKSALDSLSPEERECLETAVFLGYARSSIPEYQPPSAAVKACLRRALDLVRTPLSRYEL
jgi:RNA polymerase sigma-70 factor, ECF subfamily